VRRGGEGRGGEQGRREEEGPPNVRDALTPLALLYVRDNSERDA